jgi:uncharacterized protein YhaN
VALRSLSIEGFGHFQSFSLTDFGPGLTVLAGPNEAGKSTLVAFVRFVLFGHTAHRIADRSQALAGGRLGGRLTLEGPRGGLEIERFEGRTGGVMVRAQGLPPQSGEDAVRAALGGLDPALFRAVYAFALEDLTDLSTLSDTGLRDRLFMGALAGAGRDVARALAHLEARWSALYKPGRGRSAHGEVVERLRQTQRDLEDARRAAGSQARALESIEALERQQAEALAAQASARSRAHRWQALVDAAAPHAELRLARARLESLPVGRDVAPETIEALRRSTLDLAALEGRLDALDRRLEDATSALAARPTPSPFGPFAEHLEALDRALRRLASPEADAERRASAQQARRRVAESLATMGLADLSALAALNLTLPMVATLRSAGEAARRQAEHVARVDALRATRATRVATHAQRSAEAAELERDDTALGLVAEVEGLVRERVSVARDEALAATLGPTLAQHDAELETAIADLGSTPPDVVDRVESAALVVALGRWRSEREALAAHATQLDAVRRTRQRGVDELEALVGGAMASPDSTDSTAVLAELDRAPALFEAAAEADRRTAEARAAVARGVAALGAPFDAQAVERADVGSAARELLRSAARAATTAVTAAEVSHRAVEAAAAAGGAPPDEADDQVPDLATLDAREEAIDRADALLRARDEAALREGAAGVDAAPRVRMSLLGLGTALTVLGVVLALVEGGWAGGVVLVLGVLVVAVAGRGLRAAVPNGTRVSATVGASRAAAAAALASLGLPASAGVGELATARAEARRLRRRAQAIADRRAAHSRASRDAEEARRATETWLGALARHHWPPGLGPETFEATLAEVLLIRAAADAAARAAEEAGELRARLAPAMGKAAEAAIGLGVEAPRTADALRALTARLRAVAEAARATRRQHEDTRQRLENARRELASIVSEVESAHQTVAAHERLGAPLRDRAGRLGVPPAVPLDAIPGWLEAALQVRTLAARRREVEDALRRTEANVADWRARTLAVTRERLGIETPHPDEALHLAESRCRTAIARARRADDADAQVRRAADEVRTVDDALRAADAEGLVFEDASLRWQAAVATARLPSTVTPETLDAFVDEARRATTDARTATEQEAALARDAADRVSALAAAVDLARRVGAAAPADIEGAARFVRQGLAAVVEDRALLDETARLKLTLEGLRRDRAAIEAERTGRRQAASLVLAEHGAESLEALEAAHAQAAAYRAAEAEVTHAVRARDLALGALAGHPEVLEQLERPEPEAWAVAAETATRVAADERRRADEALVAATQARLRFEAANEARDIAVWAATEAGARDELASIRGSMAHVALARLLLQRTLDRFREAHQPAIFRMAGGYLAAATDGAYVGIEAGGRENELLIVDRAGGRREPRHLSRGTAELLYLVLRLGLVEQIAGPDALLPLVLDDVLVNLDAERAAGIARLLAAVSRRHQTLLLTCRTETRDLLLASVPGARCIELPRFGGRTHPVPAPTAGASAATDAVGTTTDALGAIVEVLRGATEPLTRGEIQARLPHLSEATVQRALADGREQGSVATQGQAKGTRYRAT